jgi:(R)-2-hydroxyacyl-CoA dehydratese activating ATPase
MNDKCAAGTGRFIEVMIRILEEDISNIDNFVENKNKINISSMCTAFAKSEIISLLSRDAKRGDIALGVLHSIAKRTASFSKRLNTEDLVFFTGGLANSNAFKEILSEYLNHNVFTHDLSQYAGQLALL